MQRLVLPGLRRLSGYWVGRAVPLGLLLGALVFVAGCNTGGPKNAVSGKVTLDGKPVSGIVAFIWDDKKELTSPTGPDGSYTIPEPNPGTVKVVVRSMQALTSGAGPKAPPKGGAPMTEMPGAATGGTAPPQKYTQPNTTPLTYEVKPGKQTYDIPLAP